MKSNSLAHIFKAKYYPYTDFLHAQIGNYSSYIWKSIFAARKLFEDGIGWKVGCGNTINIWSYVWLPRWANTKVNKSLIHHSVSMVSDLIEHTP